MKILLIRHGQTPGNSEGRYVGKNDQSLSPMGIEAIKAKLHIYPMAEHAFVSPMKRARETKNLIYGDLAETIINEIRERDFGDFEGKSYDELKDNPDYVAWIEHNVTIPNGEPTEDFNKRAINGFVKAVNTAFNMNLQTGAIVLHGGTIMSIMEKFSGDINKTYYDFMVKNGEGYELIIDRENWHNAHKIQSYKTLGENL